VHGPQRLPAKGIDEDDGKKPKEADQNASAGQRQQYEAYRTKNPASPVVNAQSCTTESETEHKAGAAAGQDDQWWAHVQLSPARWVFIEQPLSPKK
jgi:hypothetical protein